MLATVRGLNGSSDEAGVCTSMGLAGGARPGVPMVVPGARRGAGGAPGAPALCPVWPG